MNVSVTLALFSLTWKALTTRAVGDREGSSLRDGVSLASVGDLGGLGAVSGVCGHDLSDIGGRGAVHGGGH